MQGNDVLQFLSWQKIHKAVKIINVFTKSTVDLCNK